MNDVMPGSDGSKNLKILKRSQLGVDFGPLRQTVEVEDLRLGHAGRQLSFCHWGREVSSLPWSRVVGVSTVEVYS